MRPFSKLFLFLSAVAAWAQSPTRVDAIWSARWVVTMDAQRRVIENGAVAVVGDHIVDVGPRAEIDRALSRRRSASTAPTPSSLPA